jgi:hypothetical protein
MLSDSRSPQTGRPSRRWPSVWRGAMIGLVVAAGWTAVFGPLTEGPPSVWLSLVVYTIGFATTGTVVGAVGRFPELTGLSAGFLILAVLAVIVGPKDGWIVIWVVVFGGSGLLWGSVIGLLFRFFRPPASREPGAADVTTEE